jgi:Tol biopolymer transport system component
VRRLAPGSAGIVTVQVSPTPTDEGSRLVLVGWNGEERLLTKGFHSATDPEISFDGMKLLFAGRRTAADAWQIFEMNLDGTGLRQLTDLPAGCRHPFYQSKIFSLAEEAPWSQISFISDGNLYSIRMDGKGMQRLTYGAGKFSEAALLWDGRIALSVAGAGKPLPLYAVNLDGTDYALLTSPSEGVQRMPAGTGRREMVFVDGPASAAEGGRLAVVSLDRPLHTRRALTRAADGVFLSPSALPDGSVLVAGKQAGGTTEAIWRVDSATGSRSIVYAAPRQRILQAKLAAPRPEPDGRGSVVDTAEPTGKLYCLNVYTGQPGIAPGSVKRVRLVEGLPEEVSRGGSGMISVRLLGEAEVEDDGSFQVQIPAGIPVKVQLLDSNGVVLKSCDWVWIRNKENRGCIGCHEDPEMSPQNRFVKALDKKAPQLTLPPEQRLRIVTEWIKEGAQLPPATAAATAKGK